MTSIPTVRKDAPTTTLGPILLAGSFCGILVAANAAGGKLIQVGPLAASATVFAYALTFLITDATAELYGKKIARLLVWTGFGAVLLAVAFFRIAMIAPPASFYENQEAFEAVFSTTSRLLAGGFIGYLVSQFLDVQLYHALGRLTKGKHMWLRNNGSTVVSQFVDTTLFITIAFVGVVESLWSLILGQYLIKIIIALLDTPILYLIVTLLRKRMGESIWEKEA